MVYLRSLIFSLFHSLLFSCHDKHSFYFSKSSERKKNYKLNLKLIHLNYTLLRCFKLLLLRVSFFVLVSLLLVFFLYSIFFFLFTRYKLLTILKCFNVTKKFSAICLRQIERENGRGIKEWKIRFFFSHDFLYIVHRKKR